MRFGPALLVSPSPTPRGLRRRQGERTDQGDLRGPDRQGRSGVWIYQPAGKPKDVVVYFHGQGGPKEATPENHLPWINHLVKRGSIVVYPRYEMAYEADPMQFIVNGVKAAEKKVNVKDLPVLAIGYSRGGAIAVEYAAAAGRNGVPLTFGKKRNHEFRSLIPAITQKMLTQHLRELEEEGVILRVSYNQVPPKVEYELTDYGWSLKEILHLMCRWGDLHIERKYEGKAVILANPLVDLNNS